MPNWSRHAKLFGRFAAVIAGAVWGYRLVTRKKTPPGPAEEPSQVFMSLQELLGHFRSEDLARCLRAQRLPTTGTKPQRIDRLITTRPLTGGRKGWSVSDVMEGFNDA